MIKIITVDYGVKEDWIMDQNEYICLVNSAIDHNDNVLTFKIPADPSNTNRKTITNPLIEFCVLKNRYEFEKMTNANYDDILFESVRLIYKSL